MVVEGDLRDRTAVERLCEGAKGAVLFHTAGVIHPRGVRDFEAVNVGGTRLLLDDAARAGVRRAVVVSSNSPCGCNPRRNHRFDESSARDRIRHPLRPRTPPTTLDHERDRLDCRQDPSGTGPVPSEDPRRFGDEQDDRVLDRESQAGPGLQPDCRARGGYATKYPLDARSGKRRPFESMNRQRCISRDCDRRVVEKIVERCRSKRNDI